MPQKEWETWRGLINNFIEQRMDKQHTGHRSNRDLWRANWTTSLTKTYASLLIEQVIQGNRSNNVFSKKAWKYVRDEFNKQTGHTFDRKQLKNRLDVLKKQYYTMKSLLDRSDFRWNESRQMVIADDEAWAKYIKVHPEAEKIRVNGCPFFQHLRLLFSDSGGDDEVSFGKLQPFIQQMSGQHSQYESEQDQSRAKWTDSLNKIFADLMVEQILQGNRSNATFNKKGWKYIHDEFNRQTGLDFNRKQLKNHHNVLRKLYTIIKSLLDQNGFSWDETECMVIAEDEAWEKYIMTHPEAETIRSKGCPTYKLLCRIFLESGADLESTSSDLETVGYQRDNFLTGQDPSSTNWTTSLDKIFADLVIEQQLVKFKNIYDQKVWKYICDDFNRQTGLEFNEQQLRDQYSVLRKQYFSVRLLLNQSGFRWDESRCLITAKDEVWNKYLKEHPHFETLRINGCPIYRQLCRLFSVPGDEEYPQSNHELELDKQIDRIETTWSSECPATGSISLNPVTPSFCGRDEASSRPGEYMNISNGQNKRPLATPSSLGHYKRSHKSTENVTTVGAMASTSRLRTTVLLAQSSDQFSISNCVKVLNELEGVDEKLYLAALDVFEEPYRRETFISIKSDIRLAWLKKKCNVFL